jgi:co-chaperonin GroES (HSP10)
MTKEVEEIIKLCNAQALNFVVIIKEIENVNITESNLDLSLSVNKNEKYRRAIVVSIGTECPKDFVKVGDEILFDLFKTSDLTLNGTEFKTLYYSDLTALV